MIRFNFSLYLIDQVDVVDKVDMDKAPVHFVHVHGVHFVNLVHVHCTYSFIHPTLPFRQLPVKLITDPQSLF